MTIQIFIILSMPMLSPFIRSNRAVISGGGDPDSYQHYVLLQWNLLYTGVTRGKKLVVIVGSKRAMAIAVKINKTEK